VKAPPFGYLRPDTLDEALKMMADFGPDAKPLAGGQSLGPLLNLRLTRPSVVIDLNGLAELSYINDEHDAVVIGALTRHCSLEHSPLLLASNPLINEAMPHVGHRAIRNRGTLGGSLAHADPAAELPSLATIYGAEILVAAHAGSRTIPASDFFVSYLTTALAPDELIVGVRFPRLTSTPGYSWHEFARRQGDFAIVGVGVLLAIDAAGKCDRLDLVLAGVANAPYYPQQIAAFCIGKSPTLALFQEIATLAADAVHPIADLHGSVEYRRHLVRTLTLRALNTALSRVTQAKS
jgi:CO/xanthine dehydrogenase FAD-binding subunit